MDPTLLALLSIFGGAALTVIAGFIGAWIQGRREHKKWLREQRLNAYLQALAFVRGIIVARIQIEALRDQVNKRKQPGEADPANAAHLQQIRETLDRVGENLNAMPERISEVMAPLGILGPPAVESAMSAFLPLLSVSDLKATEAAEKVLVAAMRAALKVKG